MYSLSAIRRGIQSPRLLLAECNRIFEHGFGYRSSAVNESGIDIVSADWDTLIVLDACRYDYFERLATDLPGSLQSVESRASTTDEFLRANFAGRRLLDTVYVTANPQLYRIENGIYDDEPVDVTFHDQIDVWRDQWDDEHRTVMPDVVTAAATAAAERYPDKRLIVHYLQPHAPYVGPTGVEQLPTSYLNFWTSFRRGKFDASMETIERAYRENLELVLPHVSELLSSIPGRTVVTADHGELFGERDAPIPIQRFGHPSHTYLRPLVEVPWHVHENGSRPEIVSEAPVPSDGEPTTTDEAAVRERLRDLGYTE